MDLSKRIEGTRPLGNEFLTWLMYKSISQEGQFQTEMGNLELWFEDKLTFVSPFAGGEVNILKGESPAQGEEAVTALRQGKQIDEAKLSLNLQGRRWDLTLNGPKFALSGIKVPAVAADTEFEAVIDRFDHLGTLEEIVRALYHDFLKMRLDHEAWGAECRAIERYFTR
jgi:hypothetical protein